MTFQSKAIPMLVVCGGLLANTIAKATDNLVGGYGLDQTEVMIVTANRRAESIEAPLARTSVITREDIERSQATDLKDLLQLEAGIDVARGGGAGGQTALFMRGTNSNHLLVLIDGLRVSAAGTGAFRWELIDLSSVERVEIVRGPRASQWGSDAIGGVIQIFTRQSDGMQLSTSIGSYGERGAGVSLGDGTQSLSLSTRRVTGFSAQNERGFSYDPDADGFENHQLTGRGSIDIHKGTLRWSARYLDAYTEFDEGISDFLQTAGQLTYQTDVGAWALSAEAGYYRDELDTETAFGQTRNITRRTQLGLVGSRPLSKNLQSMVGVDMVREEGINVGTWRERRAHWSLWSGLDGQWNKLSYAASVRLDDDDRFGTESSAQLAFRWQANDTLRWFASAGEGFRSPNFSQMFSPGFGGLFAGNPDLQPEKSVSFELGLDWLPATGHQSQLSVFVSEINDLINFTGPNFQAINVSKANIEGLELSHQYVSNDWFGEAHWTVQNPIDKDLDQVLLRRPKNKGSLVVGHRSGTQNIQAELIYFGDRKDVGQVTLSSYTLINLAMLWPLNTNWSVGARLENLANEDYEPLVGFNAPGRTARITVKWQPDF